MYKGKVIFHSLGNFAFDMLKDKISPDTYKVYNYEPDPEYPTFAFPPDSRKTMIVKCIVSNKKIEKVSFLPVMINKLGQPEILPRSDKRAQEVLNYVKWCCEDQKLDTNLFFEGDEVNVDTKGR